MDFSKCCDVSNPNVKFKILNLVMYILNFGVTYGSLTGIFGATNTALSLKYQTLVTPAGWAFSIWGPIFIWEGIFACFAFLPVFNDSKVFGAIHLWWAGVCVAQIAWSIVFAQEVMWLSLVCMLCILACLAAIAVRVSLLENKSTYAEFWVLKGWCFLQLGWICAASLVNTNVVIDAMIPTLLPNASATILDNGTIVSTVTGAAISPDDALNPDYFSDSNAILLLTAAVISLSVLYLVGFVVGTYPSRVNGNVFVVGVVAWATGGVAAQLADPKYKTTQLFNKDGRNLVIGALSYGATFMSLTMAGLVVLLVAKLVFDEFIRPRLYAAEAEDKDGDEKNSNSVQLYA